MLMNLQLRLFYFSACSQKLVAWQENGELGLEKLKLSRSSAKELKKQKNELKGTKGKSEAKNVANSEIATPNVGKSKRRR